MFIEKKDEYDKTLDQWKLTDFSRNWKSDGSRVPHSLFLGEENYNNIKGGRVVPIDGAINAILNRLIVMDATIQEKNEKIAELQKNLDTAWDVMTERVEDLEKKFQNVSMPKKGITPWIIEHARRLYMDRVDENERTSPQNVPTFDQLEIETQFEYIKRALKENK